MTEIEMPDVIGATRRAETIRQGMIGYSVAMDTIGEAYEARDWVTLKYPDWDTYCEKEFSEKRLKLTRAQREQAVLAFRGAGMSTRAIASALGVSDGTVRNDLAGAQNYAPAEVRGTDGKTYSPTQPTPAAEVEADNEADEDRPAIPGPGEAGGVAAPPAADVTTPSAPQTGTASSPEEHGPVATPGQGGAGVSRPAPASSSDQWNDDEIDLRKRLEAGETVVVTLRGAHSRLINWAEEEDLFRRVDRKTEWGNPFELPGDGDRTTVIANYAAHYLPHKPSLLSKVHALRGKALGCWCAPEPCHGHVLARFAEAAERNVLIEALDSVVSLATAAPDDFVALITKSRGRDADR